MGKSAIWLLPKRFKGRKFNGGTSYFSVPRRAIGTNDVAFACWFKPLEEKLAILMRTFDAATWLGWGVYQNISVRKITVYAGNGVDAVLNATSLNGAYSLNVWNFLVANFDRDGNATVYVDDMATPKVTLNIAASDGVDWGQAETVWGVGGMPGTVFFNGYMKRVAHIIGHLFTEDERNELYNAGAGKKFGQLSSALATVMASDDYWDIIRTGGNEANQATAARPLTWTA